MKRKLINSQITNFKTYRYYLNKMSTLAENVFEFPEMPKSIDISYMNKQLLRRGSVAFFYEETLGKIIALPYGNHYKRDLYGRPTQIEVFGENNYRRILNRNEFVIMYDNMGHYSLFPDIDLSAQRMGQIKRTIDVNVTNQKTARLVKCKQNQQKSVEDALANIDGFETGVVTYENLNLDEITVMMCPAPYVADKLDQRKENEWNEFLQLIGVSNMSVQKKERNITDEVKASMGGTIASRYTRFQSRKIAIDEINEKFKMYLEKPIEVKFYDNLPTSLEDVEKEVDDELIDKGDDEDVA